MWYDDLLNSALPPAPYDGVFFAQCVVVDFIDSAGNDSTEISYWSQPYLYNRLGDHILTIPYRDSIQIDGKLWPSALGSDLNFPAPVTWSCRGDSYFPAFSHSVASETPPVIDSPSVMDSLDPNSVIHLTYSALGVDTVTISEYYTGPAHRVGDPTDSMVDGIDFHQLPLPNTGNAKLGPFFLDTTLYTSFHPNRFDIVIAWDHGDTLHVGNMIFGFVTQVDRERIYYLK